MLYTCDVIVYIYSILTITNISTPTGRQDASGAGARCRSAVPTAVPGAGAGGVPHSGLDRGEEVAAEG